MEQYNTDDGSSFLIIPERAVRNAALYMGDEDNSFTLVLDKVQAYKDAEMTPLILMNPKDHNVYVVAIETYGKKLN